MSIVLTEVESIHGAPNQQRLIYYRCQDHLGAWHSHGPIVTRDPAFDVEAQKPIVAAIIATALEEAELEALIGGEDE
ncbi:MAG: hypothetical protein KBE22_00225 [Candidatus Accumulibacter sp.]|nr:hypothetical protein [Accumulibacter sp.]